MKAIIEAQESMRKSLQSPLRKIIEAQERNRVIINSSPLIESLRQWQSFTLPNIGKQIRQAADEMEKFKFIMLEYGFPPHHDLELRQMRMIAQYYEQHGKEDTHELLNNFILDLYTDNQVQSYLERWLSVEWLGERQKILKESIESHLTERYYAAISTLIPQLEGVLVSKANHAGYFSQKNLQPLIDSILNESGSFTLDESVRMFYIKYVLASFRHGQDIKSPLSRHAIMHGADTKFGYKLNSIRCIVLFDYLINKLEDEESTAKKEEGLL